MSIQPHVITYLDAQGATKAFTFGDCEWCDREIVASVQNAFQLDCWTHYQGIYVERKWPTWREIGQEHLYRSQTARPTDWTLGRLVRCQLQRGRNIQVID